ncbi:MAG: terminase family protein, partial [Nitrospinota bacterium]|nr:terminase family protein [Nitrospinota bacterium]
MDCEKTPAVPLLPYQKLWVRDRSRFKAGMMSRQSGKTFSATLEIVDQVLQKAADGKREDWIILSRGERQAREALNEGVKRHLMACGAIFKSMERPWAGADATYNALEVELGCGSKITALPANPDTARGFSRNVLLDEFAFHHDSRRIWAAVFPVITRRKLSIRVISTPNGKDNKFHDIITQTDGRWSVHITDIHQAVAQGLDVDPVELKQALNDDEAWAREYELSWLDESTAWLSYDLIGQAEDVNVGTPDAYGGGPCYLGVDIGRRHDLWAAAALELVGDVLWLRELAVLRGASFAEQDAELDRMMRAYDIRRAAMDETGLGLKPVEDAQVRHG